MNDMPTLRRFEQGVVEAERPFAQNLKEDPITYYDLEHLISDENSELIVAESEGKIVGSGYATLKESKPYQKYPLYSYLGFMYVDPQSRGLGINSLIIDELKSWSLRRGISELRLDVYDANAAAIRAYEKVGFSKNLVEMAMVLD